MQVFDPIRKKLVALTPEERVRQALLQHLLRNLAYPADLIQVEGSIMVGRLSKRCDIVVYSRQFQPLMIVECKQPEVAISQKVLDQVCRYNLALHVPYLLLTNGNNSLMLRVSEAEPHLTMLPAIPRYDELCSNL